MTAMQSSRIRYGQPLQTRWPHVTLQSVSVNGYSTWGQRLTCAICGTVDESHSGSSVSWEDSPGRFAWAHRECGAVPVDPYGRLA